MIVKQTTFRVKRGDMDELVELHKRAPKLEEHPVARFYTPKYAPGDVAVLEFEFESLADIEAYEQEWHALPETPAFLAEFMDCVEHVVSVEVWELH